MFKRSKKEVVVITEEWTLGQVADLCWNMDPTKNYRTATTLLTLYPGAFAELLVVLALDALEHSPGSRDMRLDDALYAYGRYRGDCEEAERNKVYSTYLAGMPEKTE